MITMTANTVPMPMYTSLVPPHLLGCPHGLGQGEATGALCGSRAGHTNGEKLHGTASGA
jgi:hypothetical protein